MSKVPKIGITDIAQISKAWKPPLDFCLNTQLLIDISYDHFTGIMR